MNPKELARELAKLFPSVARVVLAQLIEWQRKGQRVAMPALIQAIENADAAAATEVLLSRAISLTPSTILPNAAEAFAVAVAHQPSVAETATERAMVRRVAETVTEAARVGARAMPQTEARLAMKQRETPRQSLPAASLREGQRLAAAARYGDDALKYLRSSARDGIRAAIQDGIARGINPRDTARGLRLMVGLGDTQTLWVMNLQNELETQQYGAALRRKLVNGPIARTIEKRQRDGSPFTKAEVERIVITYADKWRAWHAETISRTMTLDLLRHAQIAQIREAQARGEYGDAPITKRWQTEVDGRERDAHRDLHLSEIALNAQWDDDGVLRDVPGGFNCRCSMFFRVGIRRGL